jgi:arginine N-succinyltransferase
MAKHRAWFGTRVIAELRGWQDADGRSPVWEAVGSHFYNMTLAEADRFGSVRGNQFIADLGPRHPIYTSLLPSAAQSALGKPHDDGRAAYAMLLKEGFCDEGYVDIFDGGPTPVAEINRLATVRNSKVAQFRGVARQADVDALVSAGAGSEFRVLRTNVSFENAELRLPAISARILDVAHGEDLMWSPLDSSRA